MSTEEDSFKSKQISHFLSVTGCDEQTANHYLDAANQDLTIALDQFYLDSTNQLSSNPTNQLSSKNDNQDASQISSKVVNKSNFGKSQSKGQQPGKSTFGSSTLKTFDMLKNESRMDDSDQSDDDEEQRMYAGGEKSGLAVKGPPKKKGETATAGSDLVRGILEQAAKGTREEDDRSDVNTLKAFTGRGKKLGDPVDSGEEQLPSLGEASASNHNEPPVSRTLTFWSDGFNVEDGPLLKYDDPANQEYLEQIKSGRAPINLLNVRPDQPVEVKVAHRLQEEYKPPPKSAAPSFSGQGQRLGGITSTSIPGAFPNNTTTSSSSSSVPTPAVPSIQVDSTQPITQIQVRLGDGTRMVARFNHTHTIRDLRQFIQSSRSEIRPFVIQTTMPTKVLTEDGLTLKDAGLLNAVVVQRYV